jgi:hypothetical protein
MGELVDVLPAAPLALAGLLAVRQAPARQGAVRKLADGEVSVRCAG